MKKTKAAAAIASVFALMAITALVAIGNDGTEKDGNGKAPIASIETETETETETEIETDVEPETEEPFLKESVFDCGGIETIKSPDGSVMTRIWDGNTKRSRRGDVQIFESGLVTDKKVPETEMQAP